MTQKERVLNHLQTKSLTRLESWAELGVLECPARISELRAEGHPIHTEMITVTNRFGEDVRIARWSMASGFFGD